MPDTASVIHPSPDAEDVPTKGLKIAWTPVKNLKTCIVVIEQEETDLEIMAKLSGSATKFAVPDGWLLPNTRYKLALGAVSANGNASFVETEFTTAGKD